MRRPILALAALLLAAAGAFYLATTPRPLPAPVLAALPEGDPARGDILFRAGGCASCHAAPGTTGEDRLRLAGGLVLKSDFGDFVAPNISPHPTDGIGAWSAADFANAMLRGVSPEGSHYYPAFPYTSFARMEPADVADLWAYLGTLPAAEGRPPQHDLAFPFGFRRGIGLWKLAYLDPAPVVAIDASDPVLARGRYLVEAVGHCGECHTPRDLAGGPERGRWLAGGPAPEGDGRIPNITPGGELGRWSPGEIAYYLETGFTPEFDVVGGAMSEVQRNMATLPAEDRAAIAAYLKAVPSQP